MAGDGGGGGGGDDDGWISFLVIVPEQHTQKTYTKKHTHSHTRTHTHTPSTRKLRPVLL